ncbi:MAG: TAXI family TRAP transporter solute-binding subunit [bacterium]
MVNSIFRGALIVLLAALLPSYQLFAVTTFVTIGTGGLTGVYYPTGGAIAKIVNKNRKQHGIRFTVESTDGSVFNVNAVMDGQFEFGIVQSDRQCQATRGTGEWEQAGPQKELRSVFSIYPELCSLLVAVDANINSLMDLKGKRVNLGNHGSGHLGNSMDVLNSIGLDPVTELAAFYIDPVEAPKLLQDGKLDAFFYTVGHPSVAVKEAISGGRKVKFIPLQNGEIDEMVGNRPYYSKMKIPIKYYPGIQNTRDVDTFGVCATLVTSAKVPDKVVYTVTRAIFENLEAFKELHPAYAMTTRKSMLTCLSAPIHPGAMQYYRETGLK